MSDVLDDERRELFLQTLHSIRDQKQEDDDRDAELQQARQEELECERRAAEERRLEETKSHEAHQNREPERKQHKRSDSEKDYGIEDPSPVNKKWKETDSHAKTRPQAHVGGSNFSRRPQSSKRAPQNIYTRGLAVMHTFQHLLLRTAKSMSESPTVLLRTLVFLIAFLLALSRRDSREWLTRVTSIGWDRLKRTIGMGVKVSYI